MSRSKLRVVVPVMVVVFLFTVVVSPPAALGASWADRGSAVFGRFLDVLLGLRGEEGCIYDPNGRCRERQAVEANPSARLVSANDGCGYDPNGRCGSGLAVEREAGCGFDPNGGCQP